MEKGERGGGMEGRVGPPASTVTSLGMAMLELTKKTLGFYAITPKRTICRKIAKFKF